MSEVLKKMGIDLQDIPASEYIADEQTGVFYNGGGQSIWLSDYFQVVGSGELEEKSYYILATKTHRFLLAWEALGQKEGIAVLRNFIRNISLNRRNQDRLFNYIQTSKIAHHWTITETAGWTGDAYILPNGEVIGDAAHTFYRLPVSQAMAYAYAEQGTLQEWRDHIGNYASGNTRLCLFLGAAFAAPFLKMMNIDGGIFHVYGDSSSGKTTSQKVAQSVWGHGKETLVSWNTTGLAAINNAAARNDGLISLDEISLDQTGRAVANCAYSIANGIGKGQGSKFGGNRPEIRFTVLGISSGEHNLETHMKAKRQEVMAGQLVRCPSIIHRLENHHHFPDMRTFTDHLNEAVTQYYGSAGRAFIAEIVKDKEQVKAQFKAHYQQYFKSFLALVQNDISGQQQRTMRLFVIAATALALADKWGIVSLKAGEAVENIAHCFLDWQQMQPKGNYEDEQIIEAAERFFQRYADGRRFVDWDSVETEDNHAGYRKGTGAEVDYWVTPAVFEEEIVMGKDKQKVCQVLAQLKWLQHKNGRYQLQRKDKGRFYVFRNAVIPAGENEN